MHNAKKLFNTDISGGMPAVLIKMLASSDPGVVRLLPARPEAWTSGTIEGILCRGRIEHPAAVLGRQGGFGDLSLGQGPGRPHPRARGDRTAAAAKGDGGIRAAGDAKSRRFRCPPAGKITVEFRLK